MAKQHFFSSRDSTSQEMNRFINEVCRKGDNNNNGSITGILQMSSKPLACWFPTSLCSKI